MPKFVPVVDSEKPLSEQSKNDPSMAAHRRFDDPHSVQQADRGWKQGDVGWGVVRSFGDDEKDLGAQVLKHAEGTNKMVRNEKGLWVKAKSLGDGDDAVVSNSSAGMGRGRGKGGISVLDKLMQDSKQDVSGVASTADDNDRDDRRYRDKGEHDEERDRYRVHHRQRSHSHNEDKNEKASQRDKEEVKEKSRNGDRGRPRSRERQSSPRRQQERDGRDEGRRKKRSPSHSRSHSRGRDKDRGRGRGRSRSRSSSSLSRSESPQRHRKSRRRYSPSRSRSRSRSDSRRRENKGSRRDSGRDRERNRDRDRDGKRYDSRDRRSREDSRKRRYTRSPSSSPNDRNRSRRDYVRDRDRDRDRDRNRKKSRKSISRSSSPSHSRRGDDARHDHRRSEPSPSPSRNSTDQKKQEESVESVEEFKVTAIQVVNHLQETFANNKMSVEKRLKELTEIFAEDCKIVSLKTLKVYIEGKDNIEASFRQTKAADVTVSKRIFLECEKGTSSDKNTFCFDFHRKRLAPGLGDPEKENLLLYECKGPKIVQIWGMVDADHFSDNTSLKEIDVYASKPWQYVKAIVANSWNVEEKIVQDCAHFHDYDHMEVWG